MAYYYDINTKKYLSLGPLDVIAHLKKCGDNPHGLIDGAAAMEEEFFDASEDDDEIYSGDRVYREEDDPAHLAVADYWVFANGIPYFRQPQECPFCRSALLIIKGRRWFRRPGEATKLTPAGNPLRPWRCDVVCKCARCSYVPQFGLLLTKDLFEEARRNVEAYGLDFTQPLRYDDANAIAGRTE